MEKQKEKSKIIYWIFLCVLFSVMLFLTYPRDRKKDAKQFPIVLFGDSVTGLVRDETGVAGRLEEKLGKKVYNAALGGTCISRLDTENRLDYGKDSLSLVAIARAVAMDDFGPQKTARIREPMTEYFEETIEGLAQVDFSGMEIALIEHGLNDFYAGVPLKNEENPTDEYTFAGALRSSINSLQGAYPDLRIILVTPTFTWLTVDRIGCDEYDVGYGNLEAYVNEEIKIAAETGVEVIDLYHDFFLHDRYEDWSIYTADGLHPNTEGREKIAQAIADYLIGGDRQ